MDISVFSVISHPPFNLFVHRPGVSPVTAYIKFGVTSRRHRGSSRLVTRHTMIHEIVILNIFVKESFLNKEHLCSKFYCLFQRETILRYYTIRKLLKVVKIQIPEMTITVNPFLQTPSSEAWKRISILD